MATTTMYRIGKGFPPWSICTYLMPLPPAETVKQKISFHFCANLTLHQKWWMTALCTTYVCACLLRLKVVAHLGASWINTTAHGVYVPTQAWRSEQVLSYGNTHIRRASNTNYKNYHKRLTNSALSHLMRCWLCYRWMLSLTRDTHGREKLIT